MEIVKLSFMIGTKKWFLVDSAYRLLKTVLLLRLFRFLQSRDSIIFIRQGIYHRGGHSDRLFPLCPEFFTIVFECFAASFPSGHPVRSKVPKVLS